MALRNQIAVKAAPGLHTQPSPIAIPPGAVIEGQDLDSLRDSAYHLRRGYEFFGNALASPALQLIQYRNRTIVHFGTDIFYDSTGLGTYSNYTGTPFSAPDASSRIHYEEGAQNLYLSTDRGIMVTHQLGGAIRMSGMPKGLDVNPAQSGTGGGFQSPDTQLAYQSVFLRKDPNGNEIPGPAGFPDFVTNRAPVDVVFSYAAGVVTVTHTAHGYANGDEIEISDVSDPLFEAGPHLITFIDANSYSYTVAGAPPGAGTGKASKFQDVTLSITLSTELVAGDFLEIYRSLMSATEDDPPGSSVFLVRRLELSGADIAAGIVTYTDTLEQSGLGVDLESNKGQNGPSQTPDRPPWARYLQRWKGIFWYAHTRQLHALNLKFLDVASLVDDTSSITINDASSTRTYTFSAAENQGARKFKRFTTGTLAENIRNTMRSFVKILNRDGFTVEGFYTSEVDADPGKITLRRKAFNLPAFSVTANNSTTGGRFEPTIPTSGTTLSSDDSYQRNGIINSREGRPEAAPIQNEWRVGSDLDEITGILAISDALLIFTQGGAWKITGSSDGGAGDTFLLEELDLAIVLLAPETLVRLDDHAYGYFNQGVCRVSSSASAIVSEGKIGNRLLTISQFPNFSRIAHAIASESDHKYILFTQQGSGDTYAKIAFPYLYLSNLWLGPWLRPAVAGLVLKGADKIYLARPDVNRVVEERKTFASGGADFRDESYGVTVTAVGTTTSPPAPYVGTFTTVTVQYTAPPDLEEGWEFRQGFRGAETIAAEDLGASSWRLTLDGEYPDFTTGAATLYKPIDGILHYVLDGGNAATLKQASRYQAYFENPNPTKIRLGFQSDMQATMTWLEVCHLPTSGTGWGDDWGSNWGGGGAGARSEPCLKPVPRSHQRHRVMHCFVRHKSAGQSMVLLETALSTRVISSTTHRDH